MGLKTKIMQKRGKASLLFINIYRLLHGKELVSYDANEDLFYMTYRVGNETQERRFYFVSLYSIKRKFWKIGVVERLHRLARYYSLDTIEIKDGDVVIDVGANIGEIGAYFSHVKGIKELKYYGLEPMTKEGRCCQLNNPQGKVFQQALWKENCMMHFYQETTGRNDSSLITPVHYDSKESIQVITLPTFMAQQEIEKIKILKIETEGSEPEVIMGAEEVLERIEYIAADLGPERGENEQWTLPMVSNFLYPRGFELTGMLNKEALNFLFCRKDTR